MTIKKTLLILALGASVIVSCKKKDDPAPVAPAPAATKTSLLINKNWKVTALSTTTSLSSTPINTYATFKDCEKDDITRFSAASAAASSGTLSTDVKTKCDDTDVNEMGTWAFNAAQTEITDDEGMTAKIVELTATTFKSTISGTDPDLGTYTSTITMTAQ